MRMDMPYATLLRVGHMQNRHKFAKSCGDFETLEPRVIKGSQGNSC